MNQTFLKAASKTNLIVYIVLAFCATLFFSMLFSACTPAPTKVASATVVEALGLGNDEPYAKAFEPIDFQFPLDHGPHPAYRTEWWYYTGNVTDADGGRYGYQLTFFRSALTPEVAERESTLAADQLYMAHFAITSEPADRHDSFERFARGDGNVAGATGDPTYSVWLDAWSAREIEPGIVELKASAQGEEGEVALDLRLHEVRAPLLHGNLGLSQKGGNAGNANYYYSLIETDTTGTMTSNGETFDVTGWSWMDHEFGTSALDSDIVGWDWFSVLLDDGTAFMFGEFHNAEGGNRSVYEGTLAFADGEQIVLGAGDFELESLGEWTSPESGIVYPHGWRVRFSQHDIELEIAPIVADQEMDVSFLYYEGSTEVRATVAGNEIGGRGYVELTGYSGISENQR